jgi:Fe-S cluster assembly iron-binding protein IscA
MIIATETVQKKMEELIKEKKDAPQGVRVYLQGGG